jgi:hypothetical protein
VTVRMGSKAFVLAPRLPVDLQDSHIATTAHESLFIQQQILVQRVISLGWMDHSLAISIVWLPDRTR